MQSTALEWLTTCWLIDMLSYSDVSLGGEQEFEMRCGVECDFHG